jgi:hypothetical protein
MFPILQPSLLFCAGLKHAQHVSGEMTTTFRRRGIAHGKAAQS